MRPLPWANGVLLAPIAALGDNIWVGGHVVFLPGVKVGSGCVIGAGSVVVHDLPADCVAVGNPCRVLRKITERDSIYYQHPQA